MKAKEVSPSPLPKLALSIPVSTGALPESPRRAAEEATGPGAALEERRGRAEMRTRTEADPNRLGQQAQSAGDPEIRIPAAGLPSGRLRRKPSSGRSVREWR
jgi:hypothetical protein